MTIGTVEDLGVGGGVPEGLLTPIDSRLMAVFVRPQLSLVSVAKLVDFELGQVTYADFIGISVVPCG